MRSPAAKQSRSRHLEIKMTSMIDVVFLLLIFFVCTTTFQEPEGVLSTELLAQGITKSNTQVDPEELHEPIVIKIHLQNDQVHWKVNEAPLDHFEQVSGMLKTLSTIRASVPIILDAEGNVPLGNVIDLYDECMLAGFDQVQFAAKAEE